MKKDTKQGCLPALWNAVGNELGAVGQGCLLMMIPLIIGTLRLIVAAWKWEGAVEGAMIWWVVGVFVGAISHGGGEWELTAWLRRIRAPMRGIALGGVLTAAIVMIFVAPTMTHRAAAVAMMGLGTVFGVLGASWLGL